MTTATTGQPAAHQRPVSGGRGNATTAERPPRVELNPSRLTIAEIETVLADGANSGLWPSDELMAPLPTHVVTTEGKIATYCLARLEQIGSEINKLQKDMCALHQNLTTLTGPRLPFRRNAGERPVQTPPMPDDVENWAEQNQQPLIHPPGYGDPDWPSSEAQSTSEEGTSEGERRVF